MDVMKEYSQVPAAVELVRDRKARVKTSFQALSDPQLSNLSQDTEEVMLCSKEEVGSI